MKSLGYYLPLFLLVFTPVCLHSQEAPANSVILSEPHHKAEFLPLASVEGTKYWDRGYLIAFELQGGSRVSPTKPAVLLYDRNGRVAREAIVWFDDAVTVSVGDAAVTDTGKLMVATGMSNPTGNFSNYIAEIDDTGHVGRAIRTPDFLPIQICATGDGTVWSFGVDRYPQYPPGKMFLLRQFSFEKGQLQAMLDWSGLKFSDWNLVDNRNSGLMRLHCTSQKVGVLNWKSQEWVEVDISTNTLRTVKIRSFPTLEKGGASVITGSALNESGEVFASIFYQPRLGVAPTKGIYKLYFDNKGGGTWVPVTGSIVSTWNTSGVRLLGTDGPALVYTRLEGTAYWSNVGSK